MSSKNEKESDISATKVAINTTKIDAIAAAVVPRERPASIRGNGVKNAGTRLTGAIQTNEKYKTAVASPASTPTITFFDMVCS